MQTAIGFYFMFVGIISFVVDIVGCDLTTTERLKLKKCMLIFIALIEAGGYLLTGGM